MGLRKKFFILAGLAGAVMAVISMIGFYISYSNLEESVESEISAVIEERSADMHGWIVEKGSTAKHMASSREALGEHPDILTLQDALGLAKTEPAVLDISVGDENGMFLCYYDGDISAELDPRTRDWYLDCKKLKSGEVLYTEAYQDSSTKKMVVTAASPVYINGQFHSAVCSDITLATLDEQVTSILYRGEGDGYIFEPTGTILATDGMGEAMQDAHELEGIGEHFDEMVEKKNGYFIMNDSTGKKVFAYSTMPDTNWLVGIAVDYDFVFASVNHLVLGYSLLTIFGVVLIVLMCLQFSKKILDSVLTLEQHAVEMSKGNLTMRDMEVVSSDEIGSLTKAFNSMTDNLRKLIRTMASTSEQVAAASEELTANASQSADSSVHVAETVGEVSMSMDEQLDDIDSAKKEVDAVFIDINNMADKAKTVRQTSSDTASAAQKGSKLMEDAIQRMGMIETSVMESAKMVKALGESSEQISQIVEAISSIADQTNLLALNAAIEAARAGEAGRGFAVVAEEVRKLAAESQTSAEQIKERIFSIQDDTKRTVVAMEKGTAEVVSGTRAIRDVGEQFADILSMVHGIQDQMMGINDSVQTVSNGASNIVNAVDNIDSISRKTAENTKIISGETQQQSASNEEIAAASQSLSNLAADMQNAIGRFKV